ncbi:SDR family NAD(P)-dependent oxidoreductase [Alicyclobacillus kakegawensis]|uniref:SDR family NAD(P)-dependent oxidoreductase n=1 Tax=Alicyclobacillus kakegawensis TaxID=392012 RepID=UPI00082CD9B3|nr:SDR family NAD(P)-dependent oxidoreductase [Alicyclobacillus kakegawensis]
MHRFEDKVAFITGAASGMGRAFAERFAQEGMKLVLADVEQEPLHEFVQALERVGTDVIAMTVDVSDPDQVQQAANMTLDRFGTVDLVINNAGVEGYLDGYIWEADASDWEWTMGVNFWGVVHGVQSFLPILLDKDEGHLVNTASMTALVRGANMYGISKHAVLAYTETIRNDLDRRGSHVHVSVLCPGIIATNLFLGSRNRPPRLQRPAKVEELEQGRKIRMEMHQRLASGMAPPQVADILVQGIRNNQFYILTDDEWNPQIESRVTEIFAGVPNLNPGS